MSAPVTGRVIAYDRPTPDEDATYRGSGVLALPGHILNVSTPDGEVIGEPVGGLATDAAGFFLLTTDGEMFLVLPRRLAHVDWGRANDGVEDER